MADSASNVWTRVVTVAAGLLFTGAISLGTFVINGAFHRIAAVESDHSALLAAINGMAITIAELRAHQQEHLVKADLHIAAIEHNTNAVGVLEQSMAAKRVKIARIEGELGVLQQRLDALYSPGGPGKRFTSDDGAAHDARIKENAGDIKSLERRVDTCERCCDRNGGMKP